MSKKFEEMAVVVSQKEIGTGIFDLVVKTNEIAANAKAGQFVSLYCNDGTKLLPRPISLCGIDRENGTLRMVYRVAGKGTADFSKMVAGDEIRILGPLGNGFTLKDKKALKFTIASISLLLMACLPLLDGYNGFKDVVQFFALISIILLCLILTFGVLTLSGCTLTLETTDNSVSASVDGETTNKMGSVFDWIKERFDRIFNVDVKTEVDQNSVTITTEGSQNV